MIVRLAERHSLLAYLHTVLPLTTTEKRLAQREAEGKDARWSVGDLFEAESRVLN